MKDMPAWLAAALGNTPSLADVVKMVHTRGPLDLVILVSDNESRIDANRLGATQTMIEWEALKRRNPKAQLVCIDVQPYVTTQAVERADVTNAGGFSDAVFQMLAKVADGKTEAGQWVGEIEAISLDSPH